MSEENQTNRIARSRVLWWILLVVSALIVVFTICLALFANAGNWFTVIGSAITVLLSALTLRNLKRGEGAPAKDQ
jgi:CHASE2 domain-containing sensor protein